ncbi:MAG: hypothetical protein HW421_1697 [Ignavibacteria bacterium]|nr:hypothetical protein [Ignavibacteria bacterium]
MTKSNKKETELIRISEENLLNRIYIIRGEKVMLDFDLASLYETETRILKQAVRRNMKRFPELFMFELSKPEWNELITNCDNLSSRKFSPALPFAFTEHGVAMLSSVLKSDKAIEISIAIISAFVHLRKVANLHKDLFERIENLETGFESLKDLVKTLLIQETKPKQRIGFIQDGS